MDAVAARKLLAELVKSEQLEVRRIDPVAKDLAAFVHELYISADLQRFALRVPEQHPADQPARIDRYERVTE